MEITSYRNTGRVTILFEIFFMNKILSSDLLPIEYICQNNIFTYIYVPFYVKFMKIPVNFSTNVVFFIGFLVITFKQWSIIFIVHNFVLKYYTN